jgi:hypothetical protein
MDLEKAQLAVVWVKANTLPIVRQATFYTPALIVGDGSRDYHGVAATDVGIILLDGVNDPNPVVHEFLFRLDEWHLQQAIPKMLMGYDHGARIGMPVLASKEAKEQWGKIKELLSGRTVISSNAIFDASVLRKGLIMHGVCKPLGGKPGEHWEPWNEEMVVSYAAVPGNTSLQDAQKTIQNLRKFWAAEMTESGW